MSPERLRSIIANFSPNVVKPIGHPGTTGNTGISLRAVTARARQTAFAAIHQKVRLI